MMHRSRLLIGTQGSNPEQGSDLFETDAVALFCQTLQLMVFTLLVLYTDMWHMSVSVCQLSLQELWMWFSCFFVRHWLWFESNRTWVKNSKKFGRKLQLSLGKHLCLLLHLSVVVLHLHTDIDWAGGRSAAHSRKLQVLTRTYLFCCLPDCRSR